MTIRDKNVARVNTNRAGSHSAGAARSNADAARMERPVPVTSVSANSIAAQSSDRRQKISRPVAANAAMGTMSAMTTVTWPGTPACARAACADCG
jgi:hypothetical protein